MIHELEITVIVSETGEPRTMVAVINTVARETTHLPVGHGASTILIEDNPVD